MHLWPSSPSLPPHPPPPANNRQQVQSHSCDTKPEGRLSFFYQFSPVSTIYPLLNLLLINHFLCSYQIPCDTLVFNFFWIPGMFIWVTHSLLFLYLFCTLFIPLLYPFWLFFTFFEFFVLNFLLHLRIFYTLLFLHWFTFVTGLLNIVAVLGIGFIDLKFFY